MKIISVVSAKGGVGKTTFSASICASLKHQGVYVIALDFDPQNSLLLHFGIDPLEKRGIALCSKLGTNWSEALVYGNQDCAVLPFGRATENERIEFERILFNQPNFLHEQLALMDLPSEAVIVIDTPPGASTYLKQALLNSNLVIVALLADAASYATIPMISNLIEEYCLKREDFIDYVYAINQLNRTRQLSGDVADVITAQFSNKNIISIHQDQSIPEALASRQNTASYAPLSQGSKDLQDLSSLIARVLMLKQSADLNGKQF